MAGEQDAMNDASEDGVFVTVEHLADAPAESLRLAAAATAAKGLPLRLRASLQLLNPDSGPYGNYTAWRGQTWKLVVGIPGMDEEALTAEAHEAQATLELVFDLIQILGVRKARQVLADLKQHLHEQM